MDIYREILRLQDEGVAAALVVVTGVKGHTPQVMGAKMVIREDGSTMGTIGGGRVEHEVIDRARAVIAEGQTAQETYRLKADLGMCCGGEMHVYFEPLLARRRLHIFGAGHVAAPTAALASRCGFQVLVIDERSDWNTEDRFPEAQERHVAPHMDYLHTAALGPRDYVVITTHNHDYDREILGMALVTEAGYVGMIGSTRKAEKTLRELKASGLPEECLARAHTPIGLDILAETPDEIAVSIIGELVRHHRGHHTDKTTRGAPVESMASDSRRED